MNQETLNLFFAIILSTLVLYGWQYFYETPRMEQVLKSDTAHKSDTKKIDKTDAPSQHVVKGNKIDIKSKELSGALSDVGAKFTNIELNSYFEDLAKSKHVILLNTEKTTSYIANFGWISGNKELILPNAHTQWHHNKNTITENDGVTLSWTNPDKVEFQIRISMVQDFLFKIDQKVINHSNKTYEISPYGLINRVYNKSTSENSAASALIHEGPIGVFNKLLEELKYEDVQSNQPKSFTGSLGDWVGFSDKYWLSAIIPANESAFNAKYAIKEHDSAKHYQVDYLLDTKIIEPATQSESTSYFFTGPKKHEIIESYMKEYNINLFDRAIDYGWLYFITKPMLLTLQYFFNLTNNFGFAIIIMTIFIKLLMLPLSIKSVRAMEKMKLLQPKLTELKEKYKDDALALNSAMMELYKKAEINPAAGCLPIIVQLPVFFSLYKVIFVALEMRHAPFLGWVQDLSAPDPTSFINLFGLLPYAAPPLLQIGVWPIVMAITMFMNQKFSPQPADPVQAQVMQLMPLIFLVMFHNFPAGLMIYWSFSNILSILQQVLLARLIVK